MGSMYSLRTQHQVSQFIQRGCSVLWKGISRTHLRQVRNRCTPQSAFTNDAVQSTNALYCNWWLYRSRALKQYDWKQIAHQTSVWIFHEVKQLNWWWKTLPQWNKMFDHMLWFPQIWVPPTDVLSLQTFTENRPENVKLQIKREKTG